MKSLMKLLTLVSVVALLAVSALTVGLFASADKAIFGEASDASDASIDASDDSAEESEAPNYKNFIQNGDFSDGLKGWQASGAKVNEDGVCEIKGLANRILLQKVAIDPTKNYTVTADIEFVESNERYNFLWVRGEYYDARGGKVGWPQDLGCAGYDQEAAVYKNHCVDGVLTFEFGCDFPDTRKIPEDAAYIELHFDNLFDTSWKVDNIFMTDGETLEEDEPSEEPSTTSTESKDDPTSTESQISEDESDTSETILPGDAIPDGVLDMKDVLAMRKIIAKMDVEGFNAANADFNGDGTLDMKDVLGLRKQLANLA